jgi:ABC-2 type transport system ATP-binding protein
MSQPDSDNSTAVLLGENISQRFRDRIALDNFNIRLGRGEILGLLGPNGAGKSTALQILSGCQTPDSGMVNVLGQNPVVHRNTKRQIGYLPEQPPLYATYTVSEQLFHVARLFDIEKTKIPAAVESVIQRCELEDVRHQPVGQLSKGFRQRTAIAQTLIHNPALIILDEPTEGLDPIQMRALRELIASLKNEHAVLLSSHLLNEVEMLCDRIIILHQGKSVAETSVQALKHSRESLEQLFTRMIYHDASVGEAV